MNGYRIRCVICHKPYPKGKHTCPYCSPTRKYESSKTKVCVYCGKEYKPEIKAQIYCSPECYDAAMEQIESEKLSIKHEKIKAQAKPIKPAKAKLNCVSKVETNCMDKLIKFYNQDYQCDMYKCEKMNIISMKNPCDKCAYKNEVK